MPNIQSAYIHIPFCQQMCHYCNFVKYFYNEARATDFVIGLGKEMDNYLPNNHNVLSTLYVGGGTPTALNIDQLTILMENIHRKFDMTKLEEFTIEINPGDIDEEKAKLLKDYGVNRISFGVQVMDDQMLEQLGRAHRVKDVYDTVNLLTKNDFRNISLDLIYSLPHQTIEQFTKSLEEVLAFNLPHYSTYSLQIEPQTVFHNKYRKGKLHRPREEDEVEMYHILLDRMKKYGLEQYEISNFAKPNHESKHNLAYWDNNYFYGFGAGASGYLPGERFMNVKTVPTYLKKLEAKEKPILQVDNISLQEQMEEELILGLRKVKGYPIDYFEKKFGHTIDKVYGEEIRKLEKNDLIIREDNKIKLTKQGMLLGNIVFEEFILDEEKVLHL
ncbi:radical SAM family heme chaperone HemW [Oceanobacillus sp. CAU 1775]